MSADFDTVFLPRSGFERVWIVDVVVGRADDSVAGIFDYRDSIFVFVFDIIIYNTGGCDTGDNDTFELARIAEIFKGRKKGG